MAMLIEFPLMWILKGAIMNWDRVEGNWTEFKGKVKERWGKLTDDQLDEINGRREQLLGKIQQCYGYERDHAEKELNDWEDDQQDVIAETYQEARKHKIEEQFHDTN